MQAITLFLFTAKYNYALCEQLFYLHLEEMFKLNLNEIQIQINN